MNTSKILIVLMFAFITSFVACQNDKKANDKKPTIVKGLYSFGPELKSFIDCEDNSEYWVVDSAQTLEMAYVNLGFEKPYTPVYIEAECKFVKSDTALVTGDFDSTMVVTKLLKISKQIPEGPCAQ